MRIDTLANCSPSSAAQYCSFSACADGARSASVPPEPISPSRRWRSQKGRSWRALKEVGVSEHECVCVCVCVCVCACVVCVLCVLTRVRVRECECVA